MRTSLLTGNELVSGSARDQVVAFLAVQAVYHFTQHPDWAVVHKPKEFIGIGTFKGNDLVCWTLVRRRRLPLIGRSKYFAERGPVVADMNLLDQHIADLVRSLSPDGIFLVLHPYVFGEEGKRMARRLCECGFVASWVDDKHYLDTLTIDLSQSLQQIRSNFRRSIKTQINKSERLGITVSEVISQGDFDIFAKNYVSTMQEKGLGSPGNIRDLLAMFAVYPNGYSLQARWQGRQVAAIALTSCGTNIVYQWGYTSSLTEHRALPLQHSLHWHAMQVAKERGYECYDLGGFWALMGDQDPINRFKLGFTHEQQTSSRPLMMMWRPKLAQLLGLR